MWRLVPAVVLLVVASPAHAAPPTVTVQASALSGAVPLTVTLSAQGDAAVYRWELGDGARADGPTVQHTYGAPGRYAATLTATATTGETTVSRLTITASRLLLTAPRSSRYDDDSRFASGAGVGARTHADTARSSYFASRLARPRSTASSSSPFRQRPTPPSAAG
jgi:PKD repeat protein